MSPASTERHAGDLIPSPPLDDVQTGGIPQRLAMSKTDTLIVSLDAQLSKRAGYTTHPMRDAVDSLNRFGKVEIGWRESCGKTDPTMHAKRAWERVVKALRADGMQIAEERKKHGNAYATSKGGFWCSIVYSVELTRNH